MAAASRRPAPASGEPAGSSADPSLRLAGAADRDAPSPARLWQAALTDRLNDPERAPVAGKWSNRRTLAFIALSCGGFWSLVMFGAARLVR